MTDPRIPRAIVPRRSLLAGMAAGMSAGVTLAAGGGALWADQGGEAGEGAAIAELPEAVQFLSLLGLFEAQHRIVAALHVAGDGAAAVEHLEGSHHAAYDDIAEGVAASGQPDFRPATEALAALVTAGAAPDAVAAAAESVLAAIDAVRATTTAKDQMKAAEALLRVAASDMEAGVDDGQVTLAQEYRDSWGLRWWRWPGWKGWLRTAMPRLRRQQRRLWQAATTSRRNMPAWMRRRRRATLRRCWRRRRGWNLPPFG
ncbi:MAG: hypothetical protein IPL38_11425 [Rhodobacter sp.]|nr:hypothetical protein [Rhodobacter sp.]